MHNSDVSFDVPLDGYVSALCSSVDRPIAEIGAVIERLHILVFIGLDLDSGWISGGILHEGVGWDAKLLVISGDKHSDILPTTTLSSSGAVAGDIRILMKQNVNVPFD